MNWPRYAEYRDSEVDWIGSLPNGWRTAAVKHVNSVTLGKMLQSEPGTPLDRQQPYLRAAHIQPTGLDFDVTEQSMWFSSSETTKLTLEAGDVVVVEGGAGYGRSATLRSDLEGWGFQNSINRLRPRDGAAGRFTDYCIQATLGSKYIEVLCNVATIPHLTAEKLGRLIIPNPPLDTQQMVCDFLDRETTKIDALIAKQQQLIVTLREERTATITHAVTKGLNPHVAMKDSGVEWLGEVPHQWTAVRLKNVIQSAESGTSVNAGDWPAEAEEIGVLKTSCVSAGWFNPAANKTVVDGGEIDRVTCPIRGNSLIVNRANTPLLVGSAGYVASNLKNIYLSDKLWQVRFHGALAEFIHYWTRTETYRSQIAAMCVGASSSMQNLSMVDFRNIALALPPLDEQRGIVSFLFQRTSNIEKLIDKSNEVIDALREYRSALITDAVTGEIDVQGAA